MISSSGIASALADCWKQSLTAGPHIQSALGGKLTSEANVLGEKRPSNKSVEEAQHLLLCWFGYWNSLKCTMVFSIIRYTADMSHPFYSPSCLQGEKKNKPPETGAAAVTQLSIWDKALSAPLSFPLHSVLLRIFGCSVNLQIMRFFSNCF